MLGKPYKLYLFFFPDCNIAVVIFMYFIKYWEAASWHSSRKRYWGDPSTICLPSYVFLINLINLILIKYYLIFLPNEQLCNHSWGSDGSHRVSAALFQIGSGRL